MKKSKICKTCGSEYSELNFKKYCSRKCYEIRPGGFLSGGSEIFQCLHCNKDVLKFKSEIRKNPDRVFCNNSCSTLYWRSFDTTIYKKLTNCKNCNTEICKYKSLKSKFDFCNNHCSGKYYSQFTKRKERSHLEKFLLVKLEENFPFLKIIHSDREQCSGLELDFYFPDLQLAIEINGPVHYDPIYGETYLQSIQERDVRKARICESKRIELFNIKNYGRFTNSSGSKIWSEEFKPKLLEKIPFCEPLIETETEFKFN